jgi:hypothetical protein
MLHACFTPFASCFVYTSWHFYAISGINLLTRCHSASSLFSAVLCFRKATQEIFSELDETRTETPIFLDEGQRPQESQKGARGQPHHQGARPSPWPRPPMVRPPWSTPDDAPSPIKSLPMENPKTIGKIFKRVPQLCYRCWWILGDRSLYSGTLPGRGSAPGAISVGLHRHLRRLHWPHRNLHRRCCLLWCGGSSSPPGLRALPVAMWFTSLSHDVIFMWLWDLYLVELVDAIIQILCYSRAYYCNLRRYLVSWCEGDSVCIMCVFLVNVSMNCWNHLVRSR